MGRKQTEIQRRQTALIENNLKVQLLEQRTQCVNDMREIHWGWMRNAKLSDEEKFKFHKLLEQAELLYPTKVSEKLRDAVNASFWSKHNMRRAFDLKKEGDEGRAKEKLEAAWTDDDKVFKLLPELLEDLINHTRVDAWE